MSMRATLAGLLLAGLTLVPPAAARPAADDDATLFVGGGTNLTNGLFFPGTSLRQNGEWLDLGPPLQVTAGSNVTLVNLDAAPLTNSHQVRSFKVRKKTGRPLFQSEPSSGPTTTLVLTQHLKPGLYRYFCTTHFGMFGRIEVVAN
jgi:hypothetical protein